MSDYPMGDEFKTLGEKVERRLKMLEGTVEKMEVRVAALEKKTQALK